MGRRSEQRIAISFPVIVRGTDSRGSPFVVTTKTMDISFSGAALKGLNGIVDVGSKLEVECRDQKALYRVQRVSQGQDSSGGCVGLRCLEMGKYVWGVPPKEWEADTYDPANPGKSAVPQNGSGSGSGSSYGASASWKGRDRRQFARHTCRIGAQAYLENDSAEIPGIITDISLGGCYLEMLSPLPVGTMIRIALNPGDAPLNLAGKVRSSQNGFGMGVSFTGMGPEDFEKLRKFAPPTADGPVAAAYAPAPPSRPAPQRPTTPVRESKPHVSARSYGAGDENPLDLTPTAEALEALVRLLLRKEIFTQGELAEELEKSKIIQH
jgi:hypothetical protein